MLMPETQGKPLPDRLEDVDPTAADVRADVIALIAEAAVDDTRFVLTDDRDVLNEA
jgi:hypothetical protein